MKTHSEADIRKMFKQQGYKYASLRNAEGKTIVTYNTESNPKVKAVDKINEAFERLKVLPDGVYTFMFANSKGRNVIPDEFAFLKGNVAMDESGKSIPYHFINNVPANAPKSDYDKILSYPQVLELQRELTTAKFKLTNTENELAKANATIVELEKEIADLEAKGLGDETSPASWIERTLAGLAPVADRYFSIRERELELSERGDKKWKLKEKQQARQNQEKQRRRKQQPLPEIGTEEYDRLLDRLADLTDEQYKQAMYNIKQASVDHYNAIVADLESDEEEETN